MFVYQFDENKLLTWVADIIEDWTGENVDENFIYKRIRMLEKVCVE